MMILLALFLASAGSPDSVTVMFNVSATVSDSMPVRIVGSTPVLGAWDDRSALTLERIGPGDWEGSARFPRDAPFSFIPIRGDWAAEAMAAGMHYPETWCEATRDTLFSLKVDGWEDERPEAGSVTTQLVHLGRLRSQFLPESRDVWVRSPVSRSDSCSRYPVLYVHDGQDAFDSALSSTGLSWRVDDVADSLHRAGLIPAIIIVAIGATPHRGFEFADTTLGEAYARFVFTELKPMIDSLFPTMPLREHTATMGVGLGGMISFLGACRYPDLVGQAACVSPFLIWGDDKVIGTMADSGWTPPSPRPRFFFTTNASRLDSLLRPSVAAVCSLLQSHGWQRGNSLCCEETRGPSRAGVPGDETVASVLGFLFGEADWGFPENGVERATIPH